MNRIVNLGEYAITNEKGATIKIIALRSCVGLYISCCKKDTIAMAHIVLPDSTSYQGNTDFNPIKYADTAVGKMLELFCCAKKCKFKKNLEIRVFGAMCSDDRDVYNIGEKNLAVIRHELSKLKLHYDDSETGGDEIRTVIAVVGEGIVSVNKHKIK